MIRREIEYILEMLVWYRDHVPLIVGPLVRSDEGRDAGIPINDIRFSREHPRALESVGRDAAEWTGVSGGGMREGATQLQYTSPLKTVDTPPSNSGGSLESSLGLSWKWMVSTSPEARWTFTGES